MSIQKKKILALSSPKPNGESKKQRKKKEKKKRKESERLRGESCERDSQREIKSTVISSEARVGVAVTKRDRGWCRRDGERQSASQERDSIECEVRTQLRARPTLPRETRSTCRRLPLPDLPSPASSLHRITVHRYLLFNSYLFLQISKPCDLRIKETVLVVFVVCVFTDELN